MSSVQDSKTTADLRSIPSTTSAADIKTMLDEDGGVILEDFLTAAQVASLNAELDPHLESIRPGSTHDDAFTQDFHGRNTKRMTNMMTISPTFRDVIIDMDLLHDVAEAMYREEAGDYWMTTAQVIEIGPDSPAQPLHRDLENNPLFVPMGPAGPLVMINFLIALSDFRAENGATRVIPGSNLWPDYVDRGQPEDAATVIMDAGDAFLFTCQVSHGGGANVTTDQYRRALTVPLQPAYLTVEEPYPFLVDIELVRPLSHRAQKILGFRSLYPNGSPGLWQNNYEEIATHIGL
jgi:ectoine hydroxylase-related dioxygenase (phytanoyl-CoA dioxygenase family)